MKETDVTPVIKQEIQYHYQAICKNLHKQQKLNKKLNKLKEQEDRLTNHLTESLPINLAIITQTPPDEIIVNAYEDKIWINHEDPQKLLDLFKAVVNSGLCELSDVRCYVRKGCIKIQCYTEDTME